MYRYIRSYRGPLKAAILDWSGTTADKYVIAPAEVFRKVFTKQGALHANSQNSLKLFDN